jgi:hypothetical protein
MSFYHTVAMAGAAVDRIKFKSIGLVEDEEDELTSVYGCSVCGAVIFDKEAHSSWHEIHQESNMDERERESELYAEAD